MYINKIDELIDTLIDDFYSFLINKNKTFTLVTKEENFVKYQSEINDLFASFFKEIGRKDIRKIINNEDNIDKIVEIIKRYLGYYFFLFVGHFFKGRNETFINNIIEFGKNQYTHKVKISNFFNSENNSMLINYSNIVKNTAFLLSLEPSKFNIAVTQPRFQDTVEFMNEYGEEFVMSNFKLENLSGNHAIQGHNIIKTLIIYELYLKQEKQDVYNILETAEANKGEFTFIDIVIPKSNYVDYNLIEKALTPKQVALGLADTIYDMITKTEIVKMDITHDQKILELINSGIIVPISDEFLLYHKDSERYEKPVGNNPSLNPKKKEDTKIRYIVSKIDSVSEWYSENVKKDKTFKKNIGRQFYVPLLERKAILVNRIEEVKIINKLHNQGIRSVENNEYYNDLINYRNYPYINFKEFKNYGIGIYLDKTINVVRSSNFEKLGNYKLHAKNPLQLRVGSDDQLLNIVGFMIPSNLQPLQCIKGADSIDVREIAQKGGKKKLQNGYYTFLKYLQATTFRDKDHKSSVYWLFDIEKDKFRMDTYEQVNKLNDNENVKLMISKMYDDILEYIKMYIFNKLAKQKNPSVKTAYNIIREAEQKLMKIPMESNIRDDIIDKMLYQFLPQTKDEYDEKEDVLYGLYGRIIKLPEATSPSEKDLTRIRLAQDFIEKYDAPEESEAERIGALCQHFLDWDEIVRFKKSDPSKFNEMMYGFIQKYLFENVDSTYVCKSCGTVLDIKKYITGGTFDENTGMFVTFSRPLEVSLEDIPEYEKYRLAIRNMEKLVERIATITNITYYIGSLSAVKWRRKAIIKDTVDLLLAHNGYMKKIYHTRNEKTAQLYGISKDLTNLYIFELENNIFTQSSKERDYYKPIKHNNILVYMILIIMIELNESQIIFMNGDKSCNFYWFEKISPHLFEGLRVIKNKAGDTEPIKNYPILCYLIYYFACLMTKYNMWYYDIPKDKQVRKKYLIIVQKIITHTTIDILNSILEIAKTENVNYLYDIISTKFFLKLGSVFNDKKLVQKMRLDERKKVTTQGDKKQYIVTKIKPIKLRGYFRPYVYDKQKQYETLLMPKFYIPKKKDNKEKFYNINNLTNDPVTGEFREWYPKDGHLVDNITGDKLKKVELEINQTKDAKKNFKYVVLKSIAEKYFQLGNLKNIMDGNKHSDPSKFGKTELDEFNKKLTLLQNRDTKSIEQAKIKLEEVHVQNLSREERAIKDIKSLYGDSKDFKQDYFKFVKEFTDELHRLVGKDKNLLTQNIFIHQNSYIIDHNFEGHKLKEPIVITDQDEKIKFREKHSFFKTDVLYYTDQTTSKIDVFYDATTHILLGYKENHKNFVNKKRSDAILKINLSIENKIKQLGFSSQYLPLRKKMKKLKKYYGRDQTEDMIREIISDYGKSRVDKLKEFMANIQRALYQIKNNYKPTPLKLEEVEDDDEEQEDFLDKYRKRINNMKLRDSNGKNRFFKNWKDLRSGLFFNDISKRTLNINYKAKFVAINDIVGYDYHGNLLLFYIINQLHNLIKFNDNKFTKANLANLIIELINIEFNKHDNDAKYNNLDIKRFKYILESSVNVSVVRETDDRDRIETNEYGEYRNIEAEESEEYIEKNYDAIQEREALDVEGAIEDPTDENDGIDYQVDIGIGLPSSTFANVERI